MHRLKRISVMIMVLFSAYNQSYLHAEQEAQFSPSVIQEWLEIIKQCGMDPASIILKKIYTDQWPQAYVKDGAVHCDENYWNGLPPLEKQCLVGHELMHVKYRHDLKRVWFVRFLGGLQYTLHAFFYISYDKCLNKIENTAIKKMLSSTTTRAAAHILLFCGTFLVPLVAFNWMQELEATREAAKALDLSDYQCNPEIFRSFGEWVHYRFCHPPHTWHQHAIEQGTAARLALNH